MEQAIKEETQEHPIDRWIPWMFVAFFAVVFAVNMVFLYFAQTTHTGVVRDKAYEIGLSYNEVVAAAEARDSLGWTGQIVADEKGLMFSLADGSGGPLDSADVVSRIKRPVADGHDFTVPLTAKGQGLYVAAVTWPMTGQWDVIIDVTRGDDTFQVRERIVLP